jgi:hypothetical protein
MMPLTRSMVHGMRSAAMNLARSLFFVSLPSLTQDLRNSLVEEVDGDAEVIRHALQTYDTV